MPELNPAGGLTLADTAERPKPTATNPPGHPMPGQEWAVAEHGHPYTSRAYAWVIRAARRLGLALLAAADRADHHHRRGVPRLEGRRATATANTARTDTQ